MDRKLMLYDAVLTSILISVFLLHFEWLVCEFRCISDQPFYS
jgi:hypothetical protein